MKVCKNLPAFKIPGQKIVKYTNMGNIKEIMFMAKKNTPGLYAKKISKNQYVLTETGEIKDYSFHAEDRTQNKDNLRRTFKKIRELINTNFSGAKNELAFTITYEKNMTNSEQLYKDFKNFIKRLRYKYLDIDYISVVEPQERGAWHCHVLLKFNKVDKIYIPNKEVAALWGNGFVKVKAIKKDVDNIGAYLSAYLGDVELTPENFDKISDTQIIKTVEINGKSKRFIKGGRLHLYPVGMNIYRCSKGIKVPLVEYLPYKDIKKIVGAVTPNYSTKTEILNDDDELINTIIYEQYNMNRLKK